MRPIKFIPFKIQYWLVYRPLIVFHRLRTKFYFRPRFREGQLVEFDLSYAKVAYRVARIVWSNSGPYYDLIGHKVLSHNNTNPYMTEAQRYSPFCQYFDKSAKVFRE